MKSIFVVLPFGLSNMLEVAQNIAHAVELQLNTYCQLTPNPTIPLSFWGHELIKPLDYLYFCVSYMREADVIAFTSDWRTNRECSLLHAIATAYDINILELEAESAKVEGNKQELAPKPCPFCGEGKELSMLENTDTHTFAVHCKKCYAIGPMADSEIVAVLAWNNMLEKPQEQ